MPTYIVLQEFTQAGAENIEESPDRLDDAKALAESMGCTVRDFYLTFGDYDSVVVVEAPDDETMAQLALRVGQAGAVATETLKAFTEDEYREVIAGLA